jgi:colanic acid biosynthesis glycosyl transferase WcaI
MRLTILNQYFYPDHSATSQLMTELAQNLCEQGIEVTALASRGRYNGGGTLPSREDFDGVRIERAWATGFGKSTLFGRLADYLTFFFGAFWKLLTMPRQDVVMALTTPPLIGLIAVVVGRLNPNSGLARALDWLTCQMLRRADRIIVLSDCMLERVISKLGPEALGRIDVIHNWADGRAIMPLTEGEERFFNPREWPDLSDKFVVLFSGNLGMVNEFGTVLEAARHLRANDGIAFVFIGAGAKAAEIRAFAVQHDLANVRMLPYQPRHSLRHCLASGDALLITLADGLAGLSVPSKTYSSLAAGRPILFVGDQRSSVADLVAKHHCGAAISSGKSEQLAAIISTWAEDRSGLDSLGSAARALFEQRFDRPVAVNGYLRSLTHCFHGHSRRNPAKREDGVAITPVDAEESIL